MALIFFMKYQTYKTDLRCKIKIKHHQIFQILINFGPALQVAEWIAHDKYDFLEVL